MSILRTWKKAGSATWTIWDRGDELWEMKGDSLRHFAVVSRKMDGELMKEELRLLKDSPIPLEALRQEIQGWEVIEDQPQQAQALMPLIQPKQRAPRPLPRGPAFLPDDSQPVSQLSPQPYSSHELQTHTGRTEKTLTMTATSKKRIPTHIPPQPSLTQSSHETQQPLAQDSQEEPSSQQPCTLPAELWSSLSQWIPPSALFQPSLHHQAFLELSDTQAGTYPSQKDSEKNLQRQQGPRQYVKQAQLSKPYHQRPSAHKIKVSSGPLFV